MRKSLLFLLAAAALAPRELKEAVRETMNEVRKAWDEELQKSKHKKVEK